MRNKTTNFRVFRPIIAFYLIMTFSIVVFAEGSGVIKGSVKDAITKEKLPGASVSIPLVKNGCMTDIKGQFRIEHLAAGNYEVLVSYIGYKESKYQVAVKENEVSTLSIEIYESPVQMNDIVITGQGVATEKRKLTSTVEKLNAQEIQTAPVQSLDQLLQGRVTGLSSFSSSGMPGTAGRMSTRGVKSVLSKSTPVVYVDGIRVDNQEAFRLALQTGGAETSSLADLVVGEIDHIEVIKGGASSTLYGSDAANGVIQIFTKKGVPGSAKWKFSSTAGWDAPYTKFINEQFVKDKVLRVGGYQSYGLAVEGGTADFTYNLSGKTAVQHGILVQDVGSQKMYNLNGGFRAILSPISNLELSTSFTNTQNRRTNNNNLPSAPYSGFEDYSRSDANGYTEEQREADLALMLTNKITDKINRFRTAVNYDITPLENFVNKFTFGIDYRKNEERQFVPKSSGEFFGQEGGYLNRADREYMTITMAYAGSYKLPKIGEFDQLLAFGAQGFRVEDREETASGTNYGIPGTDDFDNASIITAAESNRQLFSGGFYASDQVGLRDKIFIDFGVRVDGNSAFGKDVGLLAYPKVGIAYNISEDDFYPAQLRMFVNTLKLRSSWGQTGNFPPPFMRDRTYSATSYIKQSALGFNNPGNDNLKPEKTTSIDIGFDAGLLNDRVSVEFNYFNQSTKDALFLVPRDPASGFGMQNTNVGEISNKGIELAVNAQLLQSSDISFDVKFTYTTLENKVVSLGGAAPFDGAGFVFLPSRIEEGHPIGTFRVNVPVADADGVYRGKYTTQLMGTPYPKQQGSLSINMTLFNNLTLTALAEYAFGHQVVNLKKTLRYFNGAPDAVAAVVDGYNFQTDSKAWLEDADWIKLREITLTYRLPESYIKGLTLNAS
ncbi:MAG: TonB-dependent receptor, partial [Ignavibacteria bacterium]|nr:TonB-dependent receptor [Ignavibacteria bacterium]